MTTTPGAIRATIAARIVALAPPIESSTGFRQHLEREDFRAWAIAHPTACLRRFSVRQARSVSPPDVSDGRTEAVWQEFEVVVAYPTDGRFGAQSLVDLDHALERDRTQIANTIGTNGNAYTDATVMTDAEESEDGGPVQFAVVRLRVRYFRHAATSATGEASDWGLVSDSLGSSEDWGSVP